MAADFSGSWQMDLKASDRLGPLLKDLGVPGVLAAVISRLAVKQEIEQDQECVAVTVSTAVSTDLLPLRLDGSEVMLKGISGGSTLAVTRWLDTAETRLETRQCVRASDQPNDPGADVFVTVRSLQEGALVEESSVFRAGTAEPSATARRILRRASETQ
jgi:hypothetical protein